MNHVYTTYMGEIKLPGAGRQLTRRPRDLSVCSRQCLTFCWAHLNLQPVLIVLQSTKC